MIIGFDAKRAAANFTGLGNYSRYVIETMAKCCPQHEMRLYIPKLCNNAAYQRLLRYQNIKTVLPDTRIASVNSSMWRVFGMTSQLRRDKVELFHGLSNEIPFGINKSGIASVVTIHDVIFRHFPEFYKQIDRNIYDHKFGYACRKANRVITVSECTKRDICEIYHINPDKIDVIYQNCNPIFAQDVPESELVRVRMAYNLPEKFILNVGTIEARKNVLLAVKALPLIDKQYNLVIIGRKTAYLNKIISFIRSQRLEKRVHFIHDMDLTDLPTMYRLAQAFVFPSRYEGFGIPIVEALTSGVPVVAATGSCLEEAGGTATLYVSPDDVEGMAAALQQVISDDALRRKMIDCGREYVLQFDSALMASALLETYRKAL